MALTGLRTWWQQSRARRRRRAAARPDVGQQMRGAQGRDAGNPQGYLPGGDGIGPSV